MDTRHIETDSLIHQLAGEAGQGTRALPLAAALPLAGGLALALALLVVILWIGARADLSAHLGATAFKAAGMLLLAAGGLWLAAGAAEPGRTMPTPLVLLPAVLLLLVRALTDTSGLSVFGNSGVSVTDCVTAVLVAASPGLVLLLVVLRGGAPEHPARTGALAGLVAGALGAAAYAIACRNDAGSFLIVWYPLAVALMTAAGALIGRWALRW
ncbi:hypothetical protein GCM10007301_49950 [Azorhizobium oxalatiphilum]|uniref:DUF1109 domain-containing protein n=1 Tax=Azorhizobium oxalatiphilum TaxID=980631 RepID=A0A917CCE9_9HYPH|nr:NrsF family protein [Azorhizobium oxalatiphilum]GGF83956.1 hypothetical protein GCM10007301_49950 [Azorhizobium oxalatiphilum]